MKGRHAETCPLQVVLLLGVVFLQHFLWAQCIGRVMDGSGDVRRMESLGQAHFCYTVSHIVTYCSIVVTLLVPSWELTYPLPAGALLSRSFPCKSVGGGICTLGFGKLTFSSFHWQIVGRSLLFLKLLDGSESSGEKKHRLDVHFSSLEHNGIYYLSLNW